MLENIERGTHVLITKARGMKSRIYRSADIEVELEKIWDSLQGTNKMRACLFNLIIYAKKSQRMSYLNEMVKKTIEKFPCRIIFATYDEACSSHDLKTAVSVLPQNQNNTKKYFAELLAEL